MHEVEARLAREPQAQRLPLREHEARYQRRARTLRAQVGEHAGAVAQRLQRGGPGVREAFDGHAGNGSVFKDADVNGLGWALGELLAWYRDPAAWSRVVANGMAADFSWRHQAPEYERLYERAMALPVA